MSLGQPRRPDGGSKEPNPAVLVGAGFELAGVIAALTLGAWWLDGYFGTGPWLMLIGLCIGLTGGIYKLWRLGRSLFDS